MKNIYKVFYLLPVVFLSSCMTSTYLKVMRPAQVTIAPHIKKVAIVNRTIPENKVANVVEGFLTGEFPGQDKQNIQAAMGGLQENLRNSPRYEMIVTNEELKGSGSGGSFPVPLQWTLVNELSLKYQADAILAIETYDSDFIVTKGSKNTKKVTEKGDTILVPEYYAEGVATVKIGYRLYDAKQKTITDQYHLNRNNRWYAKGNSIQDAVVQLIDSKAAIQKVSHMTGLAYGARISPTWYTVEREFYKKSKKDANFGIGSRRARVNDWEGAADYWLKATQSPNAKVAGKAAFNLALAYEVLGDLENAKTWVNRSYTDFGNKKARRYASVLDQRQWEAQKLAQQLQN
ncbi:DUF6340 family protein [Rhodocytophaga aerolata]|uniref:DUF6340 family protein n=1 Tax=Rhodocytophaga aerolata TaxID=455078 RepID=A0ABT8RD59_9BACT|nr:DUF6340 family protein [Rhodocytophaga aerolata]MDO1450031.1 DUF6340 family protein [Rhodocytophaga aerolata]